MVSRYKCNYCGIEVEDKPSTGYLCTNIPILNFDDYKKQSYCSGFLSTLADENCSKCDGLGISYSNVQPDYEMYKMKDRVACKCITKKLGITLNE